MEISSREDSATSFRTASFFGGARFAVRAKVLCCCLASCSTEVLLPPALVLVLTKGRSGAWFRHPGQVRDFQVTRPQKKKKTPLPLLFPATSEYLG